MNYRQIIIEVDPSGFEEVCGVLYAHGVTGVELVENREGINAALEETAKYWDYVDCDELEQTLGVPCVKAYLPDNDAGKKLEQEIGQAIDELKRQRPDLGAISVRTEIVSDGNWAESWKQYFKPIPVGEKILIQPAWEELAPTSRLVYYVDNSSIFGTGQHQTTKLCIEQLEKYITSDTVLLDLGCGSGILSIIGLMLGAEEAVAVDIEKNVVEIVSGNAKLNQVDGSRLQVLNGDVLCDGKILERIGKKKYDVVVANIVADVIIALTDIVPGQIKPHGTFITSGIITERLDEVKAALEQKQFRILEVKYMDDWVMVASRYEGE